MRHRQDKEAEEPSSAADPNKKTPLDVVRRSKAAKALIVTVVIGVLAIATIGFAGSYSAVREVAQEKGFGHFSGVFPIGIDAGIVVLLALDLLLTWLRMPFPLLRQTAWLLTATTIAFNGASAWPDPLGTAMHAVIPVLFIVAVEAARHAIGRIAEITADKHMESVRLWRWVLAPVSTFRLWRQMKLWELRSYEEAIALERARLVYRTQLRAKYGRGWRRRAPVEALMPLKLARYGVPLGEVAIGHGSTDQQRAAAEPKVEALPTGGSVTGLDPAPSAPALSAPVPGQEPVAEEGHSRPTAVPAQLHRPTPSVRQTSPLVPATEPVQETHPGMAEEVGAPMSAKAPARPRVDARVDAPQGPTAGGSDTLEQVKDLFRKLSAEEREMSNRTLAERWAPRLGLSADSIRRRYLNPARSAIEQEEARGDAPQ